MKRLRIKLEKIIYDKLKNEVQIQEKKIRN